MGARDILNEIADKEGWNDDTRRMLLEEFYDDLPGIIQNSLREFLKSRRGEESDGDKMYTVLFDVRHYNGAITVSAISPEDAQKRVENMSIETLLGHADSVAVEVEDVAETE